LEQVLDSCLQLGALNVTACPLISSDTIATAAQVCSTLVLVRVRVKVRVRVGFIVSWVGVTSCPLISSVCTDITEKK
jgi:hypothetical protein